jgi:hypothetical protein
VLLFRMLHDRSHFPLGCFSAVWNAASLGAIKQSRLGL